MSLVALAVAILISLPVQDSVLASSDMIPTSRERVADWTHMKTWFDLDESASETRRAEGLKTLDEHITGHVPFTDAEFYMELRRLAALADNGHSNVTERPLYRQFGLLPLRAYWFSDGLYVVRGQADQAELIGARITSIDGRPLDEVEAHLQQFNGGTDAFFRRYLGPGLVFCPAALHAVGLANHPQRLTLGSLTEAGEAQVHTVSVDRESSLIVDRPWRYLSPVPLQGETDWVTAYGTENEVPLYLREPSKTFRYELLRDGELAYIQLRANIGFGAESIEQFVEEATRRLKEDMPLSILLDNRQNGGGDLTTTAHFGLSLPDLAYKEGQVYVMTGSATFSAGIYTSYFPKAKDASRTKIVGEPVGDRGRFWAETSADRFVLPESGYGVGHSLQLHDIEEGCFDAKLCHMARHRKAWNLQLGSMDVDWPVSTTFAHFMAGRDPVLERIMGQ